MSVGIGRGGDLGHFCNVSPDGYGEWVGVEWGFLAERTECTKAPWTSRQERACVFEK